MLAHLGVVGGVVAVDRELDHHRHRRLRRAVVEVGECRSQPLVRLAMVAAQRLDRGADADQAHARLRCLGR